MKMAKNFFNASDRALIMAFAAPFNMLASTYLFRFGNRFVPEVFFVLFAISLLIVRGRVGAIFSATIRSRQFATLAFFATFFFAIGLLRYDAEMLESYARLRSLICVAFGVALVSTLTRMHGKQSTLEFLSIFLFSAMIFFFIGTLLKLQDSEGAKVPIPFYILPIFTLILFRRGKFVGGLLTAVVVTGIASLSFIRQNYGYAAISILIALYFIVTKLFGLRVSGRKYSLSLNRSAGIAFLLTASLLPLLPMISGVIWEAMNSSESRYIQGISKLYDLQAYFAGTERMGRSESLRVEGILYFFDQFEYYLLPNGIANDTEFVTWSLWGGEEYSEYNVSLIRDSLLGFSVVTFGWLAFLLMLIAGISFAAISIVFQDETLRSIRLLAIFLFVPTLLLDGTAATQLEKSIFLGILISLAFFPSGRLNTPPYAPVNPS